MSLTKLLLVGLVAVGSAICATAPATQTDAPSLVLPLPPADAQQLAANLGAGVVGAALPSEQITDASVYFPPCLRSVSNGIATRSSAPLGR